MMNSIYSGSYVTIAAGTGADASSGLPGLGRTTRGDGQIQNVKEIFRGIKLTVLYSIDWHLSRSVYNSRGWTLQELVLPRRTLIFINKQVYFRCQEANWSEESWADKWTQWLDPDDSNITRIPDPSEGILPSFWAYQKLCEDYSRRKLRSDGDTLRPITGLSRPLAAEMQTPMVEGLPGYYLDHFLLLISANGDLRRRHEFASFSWAGWEAQIMWPRENFVWYNGNGERSWRTENILQHLKHHRIVAWNSLDSTAYLERLTFESWDMPSLLLKVMQKHPGVFADLDENPEIHHHSQYYSPTGFHGDMPHWGRDSIGEGRDAVGDEKDDKDIKGAIHRPRRGFSIKAFDLANGQAEFDRLVRRVTDNNEKLVIQNFDAVRRIRTFSLVLTAQRSQRLREVNG